MRKIRGNVVGTNMSPEKVAKRLPIDTTLTVAGAPADAKVVGDGIAHIQDELARIAQGGGGATGVYNAKFDYLSNTLTVGNYADMIHAFREGKTVILSTINPVDNKSSFYCTYHDTGYESEDHLEFVGNEYGNYVTLHLYSDGMITKNEVEIGEPSEYISLTADDFEQGVIETTGLYDSSIRVRLKKPIKVKKGTMVSFENLGNLFHMYSLLADDNLNSPTIIDAEPVWDSGGQYKMSADGYFVVILANAKTWGNSTDIVPADVVGDIRIYQDSWIDSLADSVDELQIRADALECGAIALTNRNFEIGYWSGGKVDNSIRIRLIKPIRVEKGTIVTVDGLGTKYWYPQIMSDANLDSSTVRLADGGWTQYNTYEVPQDGFFYVEIQTGYNYGNSKPLSVLDFTGTITVTKDVDSNLALLDTDKIKAFSALFNGKASVEPFLFFTDPHLAQQSVWEGEFATYTKTLKNYWESVSVENIICGGDWFDAETSAIACWKLGYVNAQMRSITENIHLVVGNHDTNESGTNPLDNNTIGNLWHRRYGKTYYTFDTVNTKFFVLNSGSEITGADESQYDWFANELNKSTKSNIVIFFHMIRGSGNSVVKPFADTITKIAQAFNGRTSITANGVSYNFASASGKVRFVMAGHMHRDNTEVLNGIPIVETTQLRDSGQPTFDLCFADYDNNALHMVRIGTGSDRTISI